ncbi:MAG: ABC transporter ATP-binding protein [Alphaproteobacteria bacterium]|nr:ABC transporter ATP-binding protein [Alphaproteobacteria bacterium]
MSVDDALLAIEDLAVTVGTDEGKAEILDRADLVLRPGSIHGVVGESGCGKSTLIKAILGLLPKRTVVERGRVHFEGRDLLQLSGDAMAREVRGRAIGFIPQDPFQALNPVFRVGDQLMESLRWHGLPGEEAPLRGRVDRATRARHRAHLVSVLSAVQLPDAEQALDRYPHQFSGGQRQRLLIAAALSTRPKVILADEPTTALDVTTQLQILKLLRELAERFGLSMIFVTHDFGVVAQLCDTVTVMYAGQTVESGPVASVLGAPLHPYSRMLLACHPDRAVELAGIPGAVPSPLKPPSGCRFNPRCTDARPVCAMARPAVTTPASQHRVACTLYPPDADPATRAA